MRTTKQSSTFLNKRVIVIRILMFCLLLVSCSSNNVTSTADTEAEEQPTSNVKSELVKVAKKDKQPLKRNKKPVKPIVLPETEYDSIFHRHPRFISDGFDFPVGKPDGRNYMKALNFGQRLHLGEDWNGVGGGNTDLGDPVYSIGSGIVTFSENVCCGWGNIVRIVHKVPNDQKYTYVESLYAHMHDMKVQPGDFVIRGERIGSIGTGDGAYMAHLHLELRTFINMALGPGYSKDKFGFTDPSQFIRTHRPRFRQ